MTPWSVRPSAGCSNAAARSASASMRQAPSSTEYSEWTCRWAQGDCDIGPESTSAGRRLRSSGEIRAHTIEGDSGMTLGITGASGNLGRLTTEALLERVDPGDVVLVTRTPSKLSEVAARRAELRHGDFSDPSTLDPAFAGIDRLLVISTDVIRERVPGHLAAVDAARRAGVSHVLYTSGIKPVPENPAVVAADHGATEEGLRDSGLEWSFLRNSLYAEYQVPTASQAIASGRHVYNSGDGGVSYVSRADCAAAAAGALTGAAQPGRAYDITGPEAITAAELAAL